MLILKSKKAKTETASNVSEIATLIDEVGALQGDVAKTVAKVKALTETLKPFNEKFKRLEKLINAMDQYEADAEFVEVGTRFEVKAGVREKNRSIKDLKALKKKLGDTTFMEVAKVTLKDIDKYVSESEQDKLGIIERTRGNRSIEVRAVTSAD